MSFVLVSMWSIAGPVVRLSGLSVPTSGTKHRHRMAGCRLLHSAWQPADTTSTYPNHPNPKHTHTLTHTRTHKLQSGPGNTMCLTRPRGPAAHPYDNGHSPMVISISSYVAPTPPVPLPLVPASPTLPSGSAGASIPATSSSAPTSTHAHTFHALVSPDFG